VVKVNDECTGHRSSCLGATYSEKSPGPELQPITRLDASSRTPADTNFSHEILALELPSTIEYLSQATDLVKNTSSISI
jgi:hypothetical protein